jgi:GNAT superfamily N-acetyltransferase
VGEPREWHREGFSIITDRSRLDLDVVHRFLAGSYWARGIPRAVVERSIEGSLCFGLHEGRPAEVQVGFARVVTDYATFAWVGDVFVLEAARGKGLARWLMEVVIAHPDLQGLRRWILATRDAHGLYRQVGFAPLAHPEAFLERWVPEFYSLKAPQSPSA